MPKLTAEQFEQRKHGVGASEAAQALGLSQWGTAYELWLDKRGEGEEREQSEEMSMGNLMEPVIAKLYESEHECTLLPVSDTFVHPEHAWMMATPDYKVASAPVVVECKNINAFRRKEFGPEGGDEIPMDVLVQCLAQLAVLNPLHKVERVDVGVLVGGNEFLEYTVHYDEAAVGRLVDRLAEFWQRVQSGQPPAPQSIADVRRMFQRDVGRVVEATPQVSQWVEQLRVVKDSIKKLEEHEEHLLLGIQTHMADAATLILPDGQIAATWKTAKDSRTFDKELFRAEMPDVYERFVVSRAGSRRFILKA